MWLPPPFSLFEHLWLRLWNIYYRLSWPVLMANEGCRSTHNTKLSTMKESNFMLGCSSGPPMIHRRITANGSCPLNTWPSSVTIIQLLKKGMDWLPDVIVLKNCWAGLPNFGWRWDLFTYLEKLPKHKISGEFNPVTEFNDRKLKKKKKCPR